MLFYRITSDKTNYPHWPKEEQVRDDSQPIQYGIDKSHLFCPILWHRAIACISFCGFQSASMKMTVSAVLRFKPTPPAFVVSKKHHGSARFLCSQHAIRKKNPTTVFIRRSTTFLSFTRRPLEIIYGRESFFSSNASIKTLIVIA